MANSCEFCVYYTYSNDIEDYECLVNLDEDDLYRFYGSGSNECPYFRLDDEYAVVRKQN